MVASQSRRFDRLDESEAEDQRNRAERDRDRVLHSSALRRLAGVSQIVDPAEGYVFHNRLTHTLKVAQIGRRLAQKLCREQSEVAEAVGGVDPEIVETAALAHDLGHPPFGHIAEKELNRLLHDQGLDGFEGNAQSFRIVTKLAVRRPESQGLNLTRASLNAVLKYPWLWMAGAHEDKWGSYRSEEKEFMWARELHPQDDEARSAEAELMDWSDDIAYSVHDLEDFYRAGLIPIHVLVRYPHERDNFLELAQEDMRRHAEKQDYEADDLARVFHELFDSLLISEAYQGTRNQRAYLRLTTAWLIGRYIFGIRLREPTADDPTPVRIEPELEMETFMLKQLTWHFVIRNPALASQQYGKAKVVRELFEIFLEVAESGKWLDILPMRCRESLAADKEEPARLIADVVSSLSDREALTIHRRLVGAQPGSVLEDMPR